MQNSCCGAFDESFSMVGISSGASKADVLKGGVTPGIVYSLPRESAKREDYVTSIKKAALFLPQRSQGRLPLDKDHPPHGS